MKINGIDIKKYDAKQLTADVQPPSFSNSYEWLTSAALPTEFETEVQMGHLKLSIYFKGKDRNNIIRAACYFDYYQERAGRKTGYQCPHRIRLYCSHQTTGND